jgi:hypothetical protein
MTSLPDELRFIHKACAVGGRDSPIPVASTRILYNQAAEFFQSASNTSGSEQHDYTKSVDLHRRTLVAADPTSKLTVSLPVILSRWIQDESWRDVSISSIAMFEKSITRTNRYSLQSHHPGQAKIRK